MAKKRDTQTYELKQGNKVVYIGTTKAPERRAEEHKEEGKKFSNLKTTSPNMTAEGAKKKEAARLEAYRKSHKGRNPRYNKDREG